MTPEPGIGFNSVWFSIVVHGTTNPGNRRNSVHLTTYRRDVTVRWLFRLLRRRSSAAGRRTSALVPQYGHTTADGRRLAQQSAAARHPHADLALMYDTVDTWTTTVRYWASLMSARGGRRLYSARTCDRYRPTGRAKKIVVPKEFASFFSRTTEKYEIKFNVLVNYLIARISGKFHYITHRIDKITLLLVMAT